MPLEHCSVQFTTGHFRKMKSLATHACVLLMQANLMKQYIKNSNTYLVCLKTTSFAAREKPAYGRTVVLPHE